MTSRFVVASAAVVLTAVLGSGAASAATKAQAAHQQRMHSCEMQADKKQLADTARHDFIDTCMKQASAQKPKTTTMKKTMPNG